VILKSGLKGGEPLTFSRSANAAVNAHKPSPPQSKKNKNKKKHREKDISRHEI
jgi:hypothetical protein